MSQSRSAACLSAVKSDFAVVESLLGSLVAIDDPRKARGRRYALLDILAIAVLGCLCGCDNAEALEDWADKEKEWLRGFLALPRGTPTQDVFLRVLAALDPSQFREAFLCWVRQIAGVVGFTGQIAIDGQTNRGSRDRRTERSPIHMVHALACGNGLVLGQAKTEDKSNEIKAIPALLQLLDLRGALVSIDAMGCQVAIAKTITNKGGDYLLGLKGNQSTLQTETEAVFERTQAPRTLNVDHAQPPPVVEATEVDKGHGRIEQRSVRVMTNFESWVPASARWPNIKSLVAIDAVREDTISGKTSKETRFYISSRTLTAEQALASVRSHWEVENRLHWCLDVSFGQDSNQTRKGNAAENLAVVRHFAINIIRQYGQDRYSVPRRRRLCDFNRTYREKVLSAQTV